MASEKDLDDADWGNEDMTVEEFDFLQSQIVPVSVTQMEQKCAPNEDDPQRLNQEVQNLREQQYIQDGRIKMLRETLELRSKELDQERLEREDILKDRLQQNREKEIALQRNIDRLHSELKFKEQEVRSASDKLHTLEQRLRQSATTNGCLSGKTKSPEKTATNRKFSFGEKPTFLSKETQTDDGKKISFHRSAALVEVVSVPDAYIFHVASSEKNKTTASRVHGQRKIPLARLANKSIQKDTRETICSPNKGGSTADSLHLNCYCTIESKNKYRYPEVGMLQQIEEYVEEYKVVEKKLYSLRDVCSEIGHCNQCRKRVCQNVSSNSEPVPREVFCNAQTVIINAMNELLNLIFVSKMAGKILLEQFKEASLKQSNSNSIGTGCSENVSLLMLLVNAAVPIFSCGELINKSVIEWVLTVLHALTTYSCLCCLKCFDRVVCNLCLNCMLDGTCGKEIAFLALKFLCRCVPCAFVESFLGHHSEPCLLGSTAKFYSHLVPANNLTDNELERFIPLVLDFLTRLIAYHGSSVATGNSSNCNCLSELVEAVILCLLFISRKNVSKLVLRKGLHFLHLVSKVFPRFRELRNRVEDEYVMLVCDSATQCKIETQLKDMLEIVRDLWDFRQADEKEFDKDETKAMEIGEIE